MTIQKSRIPYNRWHATPDTGTESEWFRKTKSAATLKIRDVIACESWKQRNEHEGRSCKLSMQELMDMTGMTASTLRAGRDEAKGGGVLDFVGGDGGRHKKTEYWLVEKGTVDRTVCTDETVRSGEPKPSGTQSETLRSTDRNGTLDRTSIKNREERRENNRRDDVVALLTDRGMKPPELVQELITKCPIERIEEVCTACDLKNPNNPGGWIRKALENGYTLGDEVREDLRKARGAKDRDRAAERFKVMTPAERESIIESIREEFPGIALKIKPGMNADELMDLSGFPGALCQALCGVGREELKELCLT